MKRANPSGYSKTSLPAFQEDPFQAPDSVIRREYSNLRKGPWPLGGGASENERLVTLFAELMVGGGDSPADAVAKRALASAGGGLEVDERSSAICRGTLPEEKVPAAELAEIISPFASPRSKAPFEKRPNEGRGLQPSAAGGGAGGGLVGHAGFGFGSCAEVWRLTRGSMPGAIETPGPSITFVRSVGVERPETDGPAACTEKEGVGPAAPADWTPRPRETASAAARALIANRPFKLLRP